MICSTFLAGIYVITKKPIAEAELAKVNSAIGEVVPQFDNVPSEEKFEVESQGKKYIVYPAKSADKIEAYAVESSATGFAGTIKVMVGFTLDGTIYNSVVLSHSETPGLGDKMDPKKSDFSLQFKGKNPANYKLAVKKDGGDIDAITASTISSRAYAEALKVAYAVFNNISNSKNE